MKKTWVFCICLCLSSQVLFAQFGGRGRQEKREKEEAEQTIQKIDYEQLEFDFEDQAFEIVNELDRLDDAWHEIADEMGTYAGLAFYCKDKEYKYEIDNLLNDIHHYDTLLYQILLAKVELDGASHTLRRTIKEIEKVENKYRPKNFHIKLQDDCKGRREIERNKKKLQSDIQAESYDGRALIINNDIHTYIHHITNLVDLIDKHAHHILD